MGSSSHPPPGTPEIFPTPASQFSRNEPVAARGDEVEDDDEGRDGIRGDVLRLGTAAEIISANMGQGGGARFGEEASHEDAGGNKKRKSNRNIRHTVKQIEALEVAFDECPHPDETQRQRLGEQLGLSADQVKFWFQNRRTYNKNTQEREENKQLKPQLKKLEEENRALRKLIEKSSRGPSSGVVAATDTEGQLLLLEDAKLKAEVERLRRALGNNAAALPTSPSSSTGGIHIRGRNLLDDYVDDKAKIMELAGRALDELTAMCSSGYPLWVCSVETGRDVLNYDEYTRLFRRGDESGDRRAVWSVEASRENAVVCIDAPDLVRAFVDVDQWKQMFPSMITKAWRLDVIHDNERDGIVQLMFAEVQTLTPLVPTRELRFLRHCKKIGTGKWAIVDFSLDNFEPGAPTSSSALRKKPSGCIVEQQNYYGYCKVTWVEHVECRNAAVPPSVYRTVTESGLAFGATRWVAALSQQCERRMFFSVATNPPMGSNGADAGAGIIASLSGRQSVLTLAQRMTSSLFRTIDGSRHLAAWSKAASNHGGGTRDDVRVMLRMNTGEPGEPHGLIACAVLPAWLPVNPAAVFGFLLDESRRHEWDVMLMPGQSVQSYLNVQKGQDPGNCIKAYAVRSSAGELSRNMILQDSSTSTCEWIVAYTPVDGVALRPVIDGRDSSAVAVLPCGIVVMPDALEAKPAESAGSLVTLVFQVLLASSPVTDAALPTNAVECVTRLVSSTLGNIKKALRCEDR